MDGRRLPPRLVPAILGSALAVAACGGADDDADDQGPADTLELEPAIARLTVPLGTTVAQDYRVTAVRPDGTRTDVTGSCALAVDQAFGTVTGPRIDVRARGGETPVTATCGAGSVTGTLIVNLTGSIVLGADTPASAPDLFGAATPGTDPARGPALEYPFDGAISPVNMPGLEPQWTAAGNDLFHLRLTSTYAAIDVFTTAREAPLAGDDWTAIATTAAGGDLTLTVEGLALAAPGTKYAGAPVALTMSRDAIDRTAIYYWASSQGFIMSQTFGAAAAATPVRGECTSCHSLSRTGTRLGYSRCVGNDCGQLYAGFLKYDAVTGTWREAVNADAKAIRGSYTTFAPVGNPFPTDEQSLAIVSMVDGTLALYDPDTGAAVPSNLAAISTMGPTPPRSALMADWSPDGSTIAFASAPGANQWIDLSGGAIATASYSYANGSHTFGAPRFVVTPPQTFPSGTYGNFFFPSFSGDGALIVFNGARAPWRNFQDARTAGQRLMLTDASGTWISDLAAMNGGNVDANITWPHWAPGASDDYYWVVFASERDYGHKLTAANTAPSCIGNGVRQCKQIWVGAIRKDRLGQGDPSAPPMWLPGQNVGTNNISPYWTESPPVN